MSLAPARLGALSLSALSFAVLSLAACSSAADPPPATSAGARPSASTPKQAAPSEPAVPSSAGSSAVDAAALCAYLTGELPALQAIGSEVGAMANLAGNLFAWYDEQGAVPNGTEIDEQTLQECPDVRTEVLATAGIESFATL